MENRIRNKILRGRVVDAAEAAQLIRNRMTIAMGGYTSSGYPKVIANELVKRKQAGEDLGINLITSANVGPLDELFAENNMILRRAPMCASKTLAKQVNESIVHCVEQQMSKMPRLIQTDAFGEIDVAVVEALGITEEGGIIPTTSIGMVPNLLDKAKSIIVEINVEQPAELEGTHDVYRVGLPPDRKPIPLTHTNQRIGEPYIRVNPDKIRYLVRSDILDSTELTGDTTPTTKQIACHLFNFLELEKKLHLGGYLPPFQTGFGNLATSLVDAFKQSSFQDIQFFCGGLGQANMELMLTGKVKAASCGSIEMTPRVLDIIKGHSHVIKQIMVLRNGDITNHPEIVQRLGVIALNTAIEVDIYGNVNSSHISGANLVHGIGGGASFAQNAALSIMLLPSSRKNLAISNVVPMVFHQDIGEHDIDVMISENGVADLRGKDEIERAQLIISNCAHEAYRDQLRHYLNHSISHCGGHHPQRPVEAYSWYIRLKETGSMLT